MRTLLFRLIHRLVVRFPRTIVFLAFLTAAVAGWYGVVNMQMITDQDRLLSEKLDYHRRYMDFIRRFGDLEFLYVVIEASTETKMIAFADALADRLKQTPDVKDIIYAFDTSWAKDYALYYASMEDLQQLDFELSAHQSELKDLFAVRSVDEILSKIADGIEAATAPLSNRSQDDLQTLLNVLNGTKPDTFNELTNLDRRVQEEIQKKGKEYIWSGKKTGKKSLIMLVMPTKDYSTLSVIERPLRRIRDDIWLTEQDFPDVRVGLTGRPALQADEMRTTTDDMNTANLIALVGVTLLYTLFYKGILRPNFSVITLTVAMGWTYGFIALTLGHLNLLSIVFALVLIGVGADYGIHIIHRYQDELQEHGDSSQAIWEALYHVGSGILTGAMTATSVFLIALFTDFLGLAEMGYVTGIGILFCLIAMLLVLPAMLIAHDRHFRRRLKIPTPLHLVGLRHVSRWPRLTVILSLIATIALLPMALRVTFDDNLLNLQADGLQSVQYEHKLINEAEYSTWYCAFLKNNLEEVRKISARLKANPTVAAVESVANAVPEISLEKKERIVAVRERLASLHRSYSSTPYTPNFAVSNRLVRKINDTTQSITQLKDAIAELKKQIAQMEQAKSQFKQAKAQTSGMENLDPAVLNSMDPNSIPPEYLQQFQEMQKMNTASVPADSIKPSLPDPKKILKKLEGEWKKIDPKFIAQLEQLKSLLSGPAEEAKKRLQDANQVLLEKPRQALLSLLKMAEKNVPTVESLPQEFRSMYVGKDGSFLVMAYPKKDIWQTDNMREFVQEMRNIDPQVTGTPIQVYESSQLMRQAFIRISLYSILVVSLLVYLDFLTLSSLFYVMMPLFLGVLWLVEIMGIFKVPLNLANFFGIPILIGIGVDSAVHINHRYLETGDIEKTIYTTGTTLTLTALTTIVGFGTLLMASHKGLASFGALMTLGSITCWFTCIIFLATLIKIFPRKNAGKPG